MESHIRRWEKLEAWAVAEANGILLFIDELLKHAIALDAKDCGPTVIPSIRTAVKWVYQALHEAARHEGSTNAWTCAGAVLKRGGRHSYRGGPRPRNARHDAGAAALRAPCHIMVWLFCMIFASLRFDDAKHVKPLEMEMRSE